MSEKPIAEVGPQLEECGSTLALVNALDLGFVLPRAWRAHREAGDADDALLLAECAYNTSVGSSVRQTMRSGSVGMGILRAAHPEFALGAARRLIGPSLT
mgnify:CR=1 FL=1